MRFLGAANGNKADGGSTTDILEGDICNISTVSCPSQQSKGRCRWPWSIRSPSGSEWGGHFVLQLVPVEVHGCPNLSPSSNQTLLFNLPKHVLSRIAGMSTTNWRRPLYKMGHQCEFWRLLELLSQLQELYVPLADGSADQKEARSDRPGDRVR